MLQSNDTKTLNLTEDFWTWPNKQCVWARPKRENFGPKRRMWNTQMSSAQITRTEGIMTFTADKCTTNEVVIVRSASASLFVVVNEWLHNDILDDKDDQTLEDMSEDWNVFHYGAVHQPGCWNVLIILLCLSEGWCPVSPPLCQRSECSDMPIPTKHGFQFQQQETSGVISN